MPIMIRVAGKKFAAKRPQLVQDESNRTTYPQFDDIQNEIKLHQPKISASDVIEDFTTNSSSHGLPHIALSYTVVGKIVWFLLFVITLVFTIHATISTINEAKTQTESDLQVRSGPLSFPAVTICNQNPVKTSRVYAGGTNFENAMNLLGERLRKANVQQREPMPGTSSYEATAVNLFKQISSSLSDRVTEWMGHQKEDFIISCTYLGIPCDIENDFELVHHPTYGNCFVFNNDRSSRRVTALAGSQLGLQLWLNAEESEYIPWLTSSTGAVITVHDVGTYPSPEDNGVSIQPGVQTDIAVILRNYSRKGIVNQCETGKKFKENYGFEYTQHSCKTLCLQNYLTERCRCGDAKKPLHVGSTFCDLNNREHIMCMYDVTLAYKEGHLSCDCPQACREANYDATVTQNTWPAQSAEKTVKDILFNLDKTMYYREYINGGLKRNLMKVSIYFPSLTFFETIEDITPTRLEIWATIGMHWATFGGFSVITWIEFILLVLTLLFVVCATAPGVM